ncbi:unnamed protein product, partial [Amoebophrya sp. A120]
MDDAATTVVHCIEFDHTEDALFRTLPHHYIRTRYATGGTGDTTAMEHPLGLFHATMNQLGAALEDWIHVSGSMFYTFGQWNCFQQAYVFLALLVMELPAGGTTPDHYRSNPLDAVREENAAARERLEAAFTG